MAFWSSLARGKWIEAVNKKQEQIRTDRLPSQEGSGLKRSWMYMAGSMTLSSLARGKWIEAPYFPRENNVFLSSLARGKWIEAFHKPFRIYSERVFPRKREVD